MNHDHLRSQVYGSAGAARILRYLDALREIPKAQDLADAVARACAKLAGFRVALVTIATPVGTRIGGYGLSAERLAYFRRRADEVSLAEREENRRRIRESVFPGTDIAYIAHAIRSYHILPSEAPATPGSWHAEDALFILIRGTGGHDIGVCSLDAPEAGNAPLPDELGRLRLAERFVHNAAPLIQARLSREALEDSRESLRRSDLLGAAGIVAAGVAHDLGNVLYAIREYADAATRGPGTHGAALDGIREACARGRRLVGRLLGRRGDDARGVTDLARFVRDAEDFLRGLIGPFVGLRIVGDGSRLPVAVESAVLDQILMNLALNARQAMSGGGAVTVESSRVEENGIEFATLAVSDSGPGMDSETTRRVFEPLFTTKSGGSGLGLTTVRRLVSEAGGRVQVRSAPADGTTVVVQLPLRPG